MFKTKFGLNKCYYQKLGTDLEPALESFRTILIHDKTQDSKNWQPCSKVPVNFYFTIRVQNQNNQIWSFLCVKLERKLTTIV